MDKVHFNSRVIRTSVLGIFSLVLAGLPVHSSAQTPLDAGALQQQLEKERQNTFPTYKALPSPAVELTEKKTTAEKELKITVKNFRFEGNSLMSDKELAKVVKPYLNHSTNFSELQNAASAVGEAYRAKGWVVRSFLPKQDIINGVVTIKIIEAKFGKTKIEGDSGIRLPSSRVEAMVDAQQKGDTPINTKKIDRALLLIDDLPGVSASGRLQEGEKGGETDLVISQKNEALVSGVAIADNQGARSTGYERVHGLMQLTDPLGVGDQTSLYLLGAEGLDFARLEQSFPLGYDGLRVGANASAMKYNVIPKEFESLDSKGRSTSLGLQAVYPLIRAREHNLYLNGNYDHKYFNNDSQDTTSSNYQINDYTVTLNGNILDKIGDGGSSNASLGVVFGDLNLNALDTGENPELDGSFHKILYSISRQQTLTSEFSLFAMFSGQESSNRRLDSSEMFYLGGPTGIRAYPVSEAGGIDGNMLNVELRWRFATNYQLSSFYDHGNVHNNGTVKSYSLDGAGLGLGWQSSSGLNINTSWSHRIGNNPNPTLSGGDQDGSSIKNRFLLTISKRF